MMNGNEKGRPHRSPKKPLRNRSGFSHIRLNHSFRFPQADAEGQLPHPQEQPFRRLFRTERKASRAAAATAARITISQKPMEAPPYERPNRRPMSCTSTAKTQARPHCHTTTMSAHLRPISRRMEATAATQGV